MLKSNYLSDFQIIRPPFELQQQDALNWLVEAHTQAEKTAYGFFEEEEKAFSRKLEKKLFHVGCDPKRIAKRGHVVSDFAHLDWDNMKVYRLRDSPQGVDLEKRGLFYDQAVHPVLEEFFKDDQTPPSELIHVTCTGYLAPSPVQKLVARKGWGRKTAVYHAYHMGCYGAFPAIRMGLGLTGPVAIVHTEVCTLHLNTASHNADQLVAQTLFADGFIRYKISKEKKKRSLQVLSLHEEIIPDSDKSMLWNLSSWGFTLHLGKEIPILIRRSLPGFLDMICEKAGCDIEEVRQHARFAVHPGGPKILDYVQDAFGLEDRQMQTSREILKEYGNMSSATLPHIWERMSGEPGLIVGFAFGPGLSIHGALLEVQ